MKLEISQSMTTICHINQEVIMGILLFILKPIMLWNSLSTNIKEARNYDVFKKDLRSYLLNKQGDP